MSISLNKSSYSLKFLDFTVDGIKCREDDRWHAFKRMTCIHGSWKSWDHPIIATFTSIASTPKATSDASTRGFCSLTALVKIIVTLLLKLSASCNFYFFHDLTNFHVTEKSGYDGQKNHCVYLKYSEFALHLLFTLC